jgi:hypothetical protein
VAGNENSGGNRPTAPQNNPANISATGGAGQMAKQAPKYIPGMKSMGSTGVETMAQQSAAPLSGGPAPTSGLPPVTQITEPSMFPDENVMNGAALGGGAGPEALSNLPKQPSSDPDIEMARMYFPAIEYWASQPGSSQGTKDYVQYLKTII